jgi:multiple sugar transport system permease protein
LSSASSVRPLRIGHTVRVVASVVVAMMFLFPVFWMILTSFKQQVDIFVSPPKLFFEPSLESYVKYLSRSDILGKLANTMIVSIGSAAFSIVIGSMAGYALARIKLRGAGFIGVLILLSRGVPPIALAVPMFLVARKLGLTDKHITLIIAYSTFLVPYVMWLMRGFFLSLPVELEEAAAIDGCSRFGTFMRIIVPISLPGIISTFILSIILGWEELLFALVLTNRQASTIPVAIAGIAGDTDTGANWGALTAMGTITVVPVAIIALLVQRWLIQGLADGTTK